MHSSRNRLPTILSCGKHGTALQIVFLPRLRLCWWSWGLKINFRRCLVCFLGVEYLFQSVGCAKTRPLFRTVNRNWNHFSGCWTSYGLVTYYRSLGHSDWSSTFNQQQCPIQTYEYTGNWCSSFHNQEKTKGWSIEWCGLCADHTHSSLNAAAPPTKKLICDFP